MKVKEGKGQEYASFLQDVAVKLGKVRVDEGSNAFFGIARAVLPAGRSARCDYHIVMGFDGFPPEAPSPKQTEEDMKKAGIAMTYAEMVAKRSELSDLVGIDVWRVLESVGMPQKGGYLRINYDKVQPGKVQEWATLEGTGWKQLAEAASKDYGTAWRVAYRVMPGGSSLLYNAMTIDMFPSWEALGKGIPARALWNKVHPDMDMSAHLAKLAEVRDRPRVDVLKLIEVIRK